MVETASATQRQTGRRPEHLVRTWLPSLGGGDCASLFVRETRKDRIRQNQVVRLCKCESDRIRIWTNMLTEELLFLLEFNKVFSLGQHSHLKSLMKSVSGNRKVPAKLVSSGVKMC